MINIYGQNTYHSEAVIVGTREGLRVLADTIIATFESGNDGAFECDVFASDGEGYTIKVQTMSESEIDKLTPIYEFNRSVE